ncbi:MAG: AMP-dependent synthetase, partial [Muribaculaceae bacterium]|nr:AMP-dependent synthetase [Muribaculaceae bacterium]
MDRAVNITGGGDEVSRFLDEWFADSPYITAHTSGSTGVPKEIKLRKTDMEASARATCSFFNITHDSALYLPLSVAYIAGKMMVVRALLSGAALHIE